MRRLAQIENQVNFASGKEWQVSISVAPTLKLRLKCVRVHCLRNGALAEKKINFRFGPMCVIHIG